MPDIITPNLPPKSPTLADSLLIADAAASPGQISTKRFTLPEADARWASSIVLSASILPNSFGDTQATMAGQGFNTIPFSSTQVNVNNGWNNTTKIYTLPYTGLYEITVNFRLQAPGGNSNPVAAGTSFFVGAHTSAVDGAWGIWYSTQALRNGSQVVRQSRFNANDQILAYSYVDVAGTVGIVAANMTILFLNT
jgi:hypothetical protein